jgi:hypothetical protein
MLVYTDPDLLDTNIALHGSVRPAGNQNAFQILTPRRNWRHDMAYKPLGKVDVRVPTRNEYRFVNRNAGRSFDLGVSWGGTTLARDTAGGDNVYAGSGAVLSVNYRWPVGGDGRWGIMAGAGFLTGHARTNEGRVELSAWTTEATAVYTGHRWRGRVGVSADLSPEFKDAVPDSSRRFKNATGPVLALEWRMAERIWLGLRLEDLEYKDRQTGETFDATNAAIFMNMAF